MPDPNPLFVQGVARSGTTALADLLGAHPEVVLGIERFKGHWGDPGAMSAELLTRERFFDFRDGDTNLTPAAEARWAAHYERQAAKWDGARYVGDKMVVVRVGALLKALPGARLVCVVRSVEEVAGSWQARADRAEDVGWPATMDAARGIRAWGRNMERLVAGARRHRDAVLVVDYGRLFGEHATDELARILTHLRLAGDPAVDAVLHRSVERYDALPGRTRVLAPEHRALVEREVDPGLWPALQELSAAAAR